MFNISRLTMFSGAAAGTRARRAWRITTGADMTSCRLRTFAETLLRLVSGADAPPKPRQCPSRDGVVQPHMVSYLGAPLSWDRLRPCSRPKLWSLSRMSNDRWRIGSGSNFDKNFHAPRPSTNVTIG